MTRLFVAAALLCAVSSLGCTSMNSTTAQNQCGPGGAACHLATSQAAPRPAIQRTACVTPDTGVFEMSATDGCGAECGSGMMGYNGQQIVNGCVSKVLDCNGCGCGDSCGYGNCGGYGPMTQCTCGGAGRCRCCQHIRACAARGCAVGHAACDMAFDPRACRTDANYNFNPGPPTGQTAYPYYTTKGPRDFFLNNPPSIGPN